MEADLALSLRIAEKLLANEKMELKMLTIVLQETPGITDELIVLLAEFYYAQKKKIEALEKVIASIKEQKIIFGDKGLNKELNIVPKNEYPDSQQTE